MHHFGRRIRDQDVVPAISLGLVDAAGGDVMYARVLVVDDEEVIGLLVRRALRGHEVTVMTSAVDALASIKAGVTYDLILSDVMMPAMSGVEFYRALMEDAPDQAAVLVFLSGGSLPAATDAFVRSAGNHCMDKPFVLKELKTFVEVRLAERVRASLRSGDEP